MRSHPVTGHVAVTPLAAGCGLGHFLHMGSYLRLLCLALGFVVVVAIGQALAEDCAPVGSPAPTVAAAMLDMPAAPGGHCDCAGDHDCGNDCRLRCASTGVAILLQTWSPTLLVPRFEPIDRRTPLTGLPVGPEPHPPRTSAFV